MRLRSISILLALSLAGPSPAGSQTASEAFQSGIAAVEAGDFEKGLLALDTFVRSPDAKTPDRRTDLSRAHFYLGVAYVGLLQEAPARRHFREAIKLDPTVTADPTRFPPRVVRVFEAARKNRGKPALYAGAGLGTAALIAGGVALLGSTAAVGLATVVVVIVDAGEFSGTISTSGPNFRTHSFDQTLAGTASASVTAPAAAWFGAWLCRGAATSPSDCAVVAGNEHLAGGAGSVTVRGDLPAGRNTLLVYVASFPAGVNTVNYTASITLR